MGFTADETSSSDPLRHKAESDTNTDAYQVTHALVWISSWCCDQEILLKDKRYYILRYVFTRNSERACVNGAAEWRNNILTLNKSVWELFFFFKCHLDEREREREGACVLIRPHLHLPWLFRWALCSVISEDMCSAHSWDSCVIMGCVNQPMGLWVLPWTWSLVTS